MKSKSPNNKPTAISAEFIVSTLGGYKRGKYYMALCPAHADKNPSLSIRETGEGKILVYCFAMCPSNKVIDALRELGLWNKGEGHE